MKQKVERIQKDLRTSNIPWEPQKGDVSPFPEPMQWRIELVREDLRDIKTFYNIEISTTRKERLKEYCEDQLDALREMSFESYNQQGKVDYLLLQNYLRKNLVQIDLDVRKDLKMEPLLPFADIIVRLCEDRQMMKAMDGEKAARDVTRISSLIFETRRNIIEKEIKVDRSIAYRAASTVDRFQSLLSEWFGFFKGYDPTFTWWVSKPYQKVSKELEQYAVLIRQDILGIKPGDEDAIVGEPVERTGLLADLEAEMIPYSPEELIEIGESEYLWCEKEIEKASKDLGYGNDWRRALEYVKGLYVGPGKQTDLVHFLALEAIDYVKEHDLITVPPICEETWRMFMMTAARQKVNPFFLGGESITVSYPDDTMDHDEKMMSMRGNNIHFSRSTVFHEMIPGHHLQFHSIARYKPYRVMFDTPFWMEGWALYWEMILWDKKFPKTPENRIGMLFWRMHRCARIIFSIKFHLGEMTPQECINLLVERVGHERATAEGEVRRSLNGEYSALYQAGYMLGALQLYSLRKEVLEDELMTEKEFHDRVMRENEMPIEMLRALILEHRLRSGYKTCWRFFEGLRK